MDKVGVFALLFLASVLAQDSVLTGPAMLLSATGLATPWTNSLNQSVAGNAAFINGAIFDPNTNTMSAYNPLVITAGTTAAIAPKVPTLNANAVVALWFGFNGNTLTLADNNNGNDLAAANCVNGLVVGLVTSIFGQFAYCNAVQFFASATQAINAGTLKVPPLGLANDGQTCPTTRDFFVVDMDQSDNVVTTYLVTTTTLIAQNTLANTAALGNKVAATLINGSDVRLVSVALANAMQCPAWTIPDLADTTPNNIPTFGTVELQAAVWQAAPVALCPISHAFTRVNNQPSLAKVNLYRAGCGQAQAANVAAADGTVYCNNMYLTAPKRLAANSQPFSNFGSPDANAATNLFAFLCQRFFTAFGPDGLNCASLLNVVNPITPIKNANGVFVGGTIVVPNPAAPTILTMTNIIIICVTTIVGGLLIIGLIAGLIWYRNRSMYS